MIVTDALAAMRALPIRPASDLLAPGPLLVLASHPDDESLGCGGLLAEAAASPTPPFVLVLTDGTGSHPNSRAYPAPRLRAARQREAQNAIAALGLGPDRIAFFGLRDTESPVSGPAFDAAVTAIASLAMRLGAATLLSPWQHDPHCDHESAHLMGVAAAEEAGLRHFAYPVWGWTLPPDMPLQFPLPTGMRIDISGHLDRKRAAIAAHRTQHTGTIIDDPGGFTLPAGFLALFDGPYETVLDIQSGQPARR